MNPTYSLFGDLPSTLILQTSGGFNGTAGVSTAAPTVSAGRMVMPVEATGGLLKADKPLKILEIDYQGGGSLTIKKVRKKADGTTEVETTLNSPTFPLYIGADSYIKFTSTGAGEVAIVAQNAYSRLGV